MYYKRDSSVPRASPAKGEPYLQGRKLRKDFAMPTQPTPVPPSAQIVPAPPSTSLTAELNKLSHDGSDQTLPKPQTHYVEKQITVFQNKNTVGSNRKHKSTSKESAPRRDMIWFSGSVDEGDRSDIKHYSPARAVAGSKTMASNPSEDVERGPNRTMQNFNRKPDGLIASRS